MQAPQTDSGLPQTSKLSCFSCRNRKQRCDRHLPSCSRCKRLLLDCVYPRRDSQGLNAEPGAGIVPSLSRVKPEIKRLRDDLLCLTTQLCQPHSPQFISCHRQLFTSMLESHFSTTHMWLPLVQKTSVAERLDGSQTHQSPAFLPMLLAICLNSKEVCGMGSLQSLEEALFAAAKRYYWGSQPTSAPAMELIVAGILLSTYEYGHGLAQEAYMTISTCTAMIQVSGLLSYHKNRVDASSVVVEQSRAVWAAIMIERLIALKAQILLRSNDHHYSCNHSPTYLSIAVDDTRFTICLRSIHIVCNFRKGGLYYSRKCRGAYE
ncbi:uncharacterized protein LMH87_008287 [Akanthomyces muscarius]|uniref:Zn(2)-C6 fungal-type domain-containing protein n=1 Tax=Akanthomyces muscarius TaxID=2231603 RepID=A0A9W8QLD2_AKAMU|nr:uncharacterized protein LMH87_008287 [Akanthomyces muscarius]KAJ4159385.1 hypothetical protein LMH87_008287 [Akanthomyces muscarius]